jgi:hypothetical protein
LKLSYNQLSPILIDFIYFAGLFLQSKQLTNCIERLLEKYAIEILPYCSEDRDNYILLYKYQLLLCNMIDKLDPNNDGITYEYITLKLEDVHNLHNRPIIKQVFKC